MALMKNRETYGIDTSTKFSFAVKKQLLYSEDTQGDFILRPGFFTPFVSKDETLSVRHALHNTFDATMADVSDVVEVLFGLCNHVLSLPKVLCKCDFDDLKLTAKQVFAHAGSATVMPIYIAYHFAFELIAFITRTIATLLAAVHTVAKAAVDGVVEATKCVSGKVGSMFSNAPKEDPVSAEFGPNSSLREGRASATMN